MGTFVDFRCSYCKYEELNIPVGHGREPEPHLALFRCDNCKTLGSTWIQPEREAVCSHCYHDKVTLFDTPPETVDCPKCGEPGKLTPAEGSWE
jgi:ribosomal protein S27E